MKKQKKEIKEETTLKAWAVVDKLNNEILKIPATGEQCFFISPMRKHLFIGKEDKSKKIVPIKITYSI